MIIVARHIVAKPGSRDDFVAASRKAMVAARSAPGCRDFVATADPLRAERVHIYESWDDETSLMNFSGNGPDNELMDLMELVDVGTFDVSSND